jgi:hypothetical protein
MIRIFDNRQAEILFEQYLDAITAERAPDDFCLRENPGNNETKAIKFENTLGLFSVEKILGSIRVLTYERSLISYLILEQRQDKMFTAVKVSSFIDFGSREDIEFAGVLGKYIAELDNVFPLTQDEVENSVSIDETDTYTFMQLEEAGISGYGIRHFDRPGYNENPSRWHDLFNIREHELTLDFRSRDMAKLGAPIWTPQLSSPLAASQSVYASMDRMPLGALYSGKQMMLELKHKKHEIVTEMYKSVQWITNKETDAEIKEDRELEHHIDHLLKEHIGVVDEIEARENMAKESGYRLEQYASRIVLIPHPSFTGRRATIYCGEYPVFRGELPHELLFAENVDMPVTELKEVLQIRIEQA